ncbi:MAG: peptidoglycan-binding protein [Patescibacteria group bacterium]
MKKKSLKYFIFSISSLIFILGCASNAYAVTPLELINEYKTATKTGEKVKILIVPGHDDEYWGTEFGDVREADVVVAIGQYLYDYLKNDPRLDVQITRTQMGYTPTFKNYFTDNRQQIQDFITTSKAAHQQKISAGEIKTTENVPHNDARPEVALRLYGINKWANENDVDITLHLHINDHGGRPWGQVGDYTGIAVYIPESQYSNARTSAVLGESVLRELLLKNSVSTLPGESRGVVEDQDLIAIGARDTVKSAVALIEYGYIYEPQYRNLAIQEQVAKDLAQQTFLGVHRFFGDRDVYATGQAATAKPITISTPAKTTFAYSWKKDLKKGSSGSDVSALQTALTNSGVYSCGSTGTFGPCTETGVKAFQKKYKIPQNGLVGPMTRAKLNELF